MMSLDPCLTSTGLVSTRAQTSNLGFTTTRSTWLLLFRKRCALKGTIVHMLIGGETRVDDSGGHLNGGKIWQPTKSMKVFAMDEGASDIEP